MTDNYIPLPGDRSAYKVSTHGTLHADDWEEGDSHHEPITLADGSPGDLDGQELDLSGIVLDDLADVAVPTPADGDVLSWDEYEGIWVPVAQSGGSVALDDLTDVDLTSVAPTDGQVLIYDEYEDTWIPGDQTGGGGGTTFLELTDTPANYTDDGGKYLRVNLTENAIEYVSPSAGDGDVIGPDGATDGNLAVFDGVTGKLLKDGGAIPTGGSALPANKVLLNRSFI